MTAEALQLHYGFPEPRIAQVLINRSRATSILFMHPVSVGLAA
ncbi:hypothetical protein HaLaN_01018 [Haematococcus lacustris]|uniref:Uncharacterized protein n=1 Tax=Haematococcus lacustris TaxID=44745 RepID=A0A699YAL2_HAELA|nr:hypothetical protein HaLaN_01018 [Haematococcus lacustris]